MKIESKLILASKNAVTGVTLYTFVLTYPRVILAEVNTHRMLSRNTASSRAIPSRKQRERVLNDPFIPVTIGQNRKGMQAGEELSGWRRTAAEKVWGFARYPNVFASWVLDKLGAHKQVVNRIVEPWTFTQQVVSCTDLKNVFKLRNHKDAEPHFQILAKQMQDQVEFAEKTFETINFDSRNPDGTACALEEVAPSRGVFRMQVLWPGYWGAGDEDWHLPFIDRHDEWRAVSLETQEKAAEYTRRIQCPVYKEPLLVGSALNALKQVSAARCARVSYFLPESGKRSDIERDLELCKRLSSSGHMSPFEHVAQPVATDEYIGNFRSWKQYRKEFKDEAGGDR